MNDTTAAIKDKNILIISTDGFEQSELFYPRSQLEQAGAKVSIASPEKGEIKSWKDGDWGEAIANDMSIDEVDADKFDALVLPGGQINPDLLRPNDTVIDIIKTFAKSGKPVAAICHAPWLLAEAGLLNGVKATSYHSIKTDIKNAGANWVDETVVVDNNIITSRNPDDLEKFTQAIVTAVTD